MDDKFNTAAGWVLFAGIVALGSSIASSMYFHADSPESPEEPGYFIDAPEEGAGEDAGPDLGTLLVGSICGPDQRLPVITLAAQLEEMVVGGMQDPTTGEIVIEPDLARSIGERITSLLRNRPAGALTPALVVQPRARRALASLLKLRAPNVLVLSINELPASQPIEVVSVIGDDAEQVAHHQTPQLPPPEYEPVEALAA